MSVMRDQTSYEQGKKGPWLFGGFVEDEILPIYVGIIS